MLILYVTPLWKPSYLPSGSNSKFFVFFCSLISPCCSFLPPSPLDGYYKLLSVPGQLWFSLTSRLLHMLLYSAGNNAIFCLTPVIHSHVTSSGTSARMTLCWIRCPPVLIWHSVLSLTITCIVHFYNYPFTFLYPH